MLEVFDESRKGHRCYEALCYDEVHAWKDGQQRSQRPQQQHQENLPYTKDSCRNNKQRHGSELLSCSSARMEGTKDLEMSKEGLGRCTQVSVFPSAAMYVQNPPKEYENTFRKQQNGGD